MDRGWYLRLASVIGLVIAAALVVWPSMDEWLPAPEPVKELFAGRISPGLDIRGGLRLMYEVEVDEAVRDRRDLRADQLLREMGERLGIVPEGEIPSREQLAKTREKLTIDAGEDDRRIKLSFTSPADAAKLDRELITRYGDMREASRTDGVVVLEVRTDFLEQIRDTAVEQARETISNRVDGLGLREAAVTAQGADIIVEVPGASESDFDRIRDIISKTARLEFQIVDDEATLIAGIEGLPEGIEKQSETVSAGQDKPQVVSQFLVARGEGARQRLTSYVDSLIAEGKVPADHELVIGELSVQDDTQPGGVGESAWRTYYLHARAEVTGQGIEDASVANDPQTSKPYVAVTFNSDGAKVFRQLTGANIKRRMAIVLDDRVESAPVIQSEIGAHCQITLGGYRPYNQLLNEASDLVIVLKAGALPVPIRPANEQIIGPTLGRDGVTKGLEGAVVGVSLVLLFMFAYYQVGGLIANVAVLFNLLFMMAVLAVFSATLTLPGIAAIALNIGMAVDANVLIMERIREELRLGKSPRSAVDQGYARALWAIVDSQVTTFLAGVVLFQFGTGPIKGFAVTLMAGILTSMFSGVFCTRVAFDWLARGLKVRRLAVG